MSKMITVEQLQDRLDKRESVFILDVRPVDQREEWKIADSIHVDAYKRLNAGDDTALDGVKLPEDATIVTVCAAGRTSLLASELLERKGVNAYSLEGGMRAWNYAWNTAEIDFDGVKIIQVRRAAKGILSYVVGSVNEAIVIDAALDPQIYEKIAQDNGWKIRFVTDTHIHADYVSRTRDLAILAGVEHVMIDTARTDFRFRSVASGDLLKFGTTELEVVHTPGHTWESTTFKLGNSAIFTGDTLFVDSVGRPDLKANAAEGIRRARTLYQSLRHILNLDGDSFVLPAHFSEAISFDKRVIGDPISVVRSRINVSNSTEGEFVEYIVSKLPPTPPNYLTIAAINKSGSHKGYALADLEAGGNHCAIA